jgi:hypothetical protein
MGKQRMSEIFEKNGSFYIQNLIADAVKRNKNEITVSGNWEIDKEIRLPNNFTIFLKDCHLKLGDGTFCNVFVNENNETEIGCTQDGTNRNISIIGIGKAILDGGNYNGLGEKIRPDGCSAPIYKNNLILFTNVSGFTIKNLSCRNQRWWALNFIYCSCGNIENIDFCACDIRIDENGVAHHGLLHNNYSQVLVKNADGIDIRQGCHDITIENISGFTEDDTVAVTGLNTYIEKPFLVPSLPSDICRISIKNVHSKAFCSNVRLLSQDGIKLYDIVVDGVTDEGRDSIYMDYGTYAVRVGDSHLYGKRFSTKDEVYNITIKNVYGDGEYAVALGGEIGNLTLLNIKNGSHAQLIIDKS